MVMKRTVTIEGGAPYKKRKMQLTRSVPLRAELKERLFTNATTIGAGSFILITPASLILQGTDVTQRIGNHIHFKSFEVAGFFGTQVAAASPMTATLFNQLPTQAFTLVDYNGPYVNKDSGTHYPGQIAINQAINDNTYQLKKVWSGAGKLQTYDKDTGVPTGAQPSLLIQNPSVAASVSNIVWCRVRYYDF